ncbi:MAG TPA: hypothetical protein VFO78_10515 [Candidatus Limnocylindrales bacterium]|nr:hypothetical protein [Candidatus Limnocylindrales bacterium]
MRFRRWRPNLGPPLLAAGAIALAIAPAVAAPGAPRVARTIAEVAARTADERPACADVAPGPLAAPTDLAGAAWYRLDPVVDDGGALNGQRLAIGRVGEVGEIDVALPVESFAAGPLGGRVLVGDDDGRRSRIRLIDARSGCVATIVEAEADVVRRAILDPSGSAIVEFRVDRATRGDRGVWRRHVDGSPATLLLEPLPANDRIGLVFATELAWSADGERLLVVSCGEIACLTRIVDPATGAAVVVDDPDVGEPIGLLGDQLVAYAGCPALPCSIVSRDLGSGRIRLLAELAGLAVTVPTGGGLLIHEDYTSGDRLREVRLDGVPLASLTLEDDLRLVPNGQRAAAAIELPAGVVAAAAGGRPRSVAQPAAFLDAVAARWLPAEEIAP